MVRDILLEGRSLVLIPKHYKRFDESPFETIHAQIDEESEKLAASSVQLEVVVEDIVLDKANIRIRIQFAKLICPEQPKLEQDGRVVLEANISSECSRVSEEPVDVVVYHVGLFEDEIVLPGSRCCRHTPCYQCSRPRRASSQGAAPFWLLDCQ